MKDYIFTSESVTEGHPDKICDQIADAIVDAALAQDPYSNMAVECTIKDDFVLIYGECNTKAELDYETIALNEIKRIGYTEEYHVHTVVNQQSPEIHNAVNRDEVCAGDQGIMFGYACDENPDLMPAPIWYSQRLVQRQSELRKNGTLPWLRPDAKSQVTFRYVDGKPVEVDTVVLSTQHHPEISQSDIHDAVIEHIIKPSFPEGLLTPKTKFFINPTGVFVIGGPQGDCGLTGRKIIVDTYGGACPHGGGAFSGKDPSKVDRSAAYAARYVAKNIVAAGLARQCQIQLSYAIGVAEPINITVYTEGTGVVSDEQLAKIVREHFDLRPRGIVQMLDLLRPIYSKSAAYGHFGRSEPEFSWEATDKVEALKRAVK